jgi:hypothetical protein
MEKSRRALIKLSPMLDIQSALRSLKKVQAVHVVSHENECKELLFLLNREYEGEPLITCVNLINNTENQLITFNFKEEREAIPVYTDTIGDYLYEPNVSLLKAGFYKAIALRYHLDKLHPDSHLYTSTNRQPHFPGRIFRVEAVFSLNKKESKHMLSGIKQANITVRNFPLSAPELRKRLKLQDGGAIYLFATTLTSGKRIIIKTVKEL